MAHHDQQQDKVQYPLESTAYKIIDEIGAGVSAVVYKALCVPLNSSPVAIKSIDLDRSGGDIDGFRRETKTLSLLSHPNILAAHCCFTAGRRLWVVMPFMSAGSLQSIISAAFPDGLSEPAIAVALKETLHALAYLHGQGHLHRDVKAGNILVDSTGSVKLADFGVSASVYEWSPESHSSSLVSFTDVAGTPYWMAPEVIHSHTGYGFKADIWSFGITALELAHGRPPLSHLPPSKSLFMKITKRFRFSDYEKKSKNAQRFSKAFKNMVASCLDPDPAKRPSAEKLLKHSFFKNCSKGVDFLARNVLHGLPSVEQRFKETKIRRLPSIKSDGDGDGDDSEEDAYGVEESKKRRISGWNFNEDGLEFDPVFVSKADNGGGGGGDDLAAVKQVRFGDDTVIGEMGSVMAGLIDRDVMLGRLVLLRQSLDEQRQKVVDLIGVMGGEAEAPPPHPVSREEQLGQAVERMRTELEMERRKNSELQMELEFLRLQISASAATAEGGCGGGVD